LNESKSQCATLKTELDEKAERLEKLQAELKSTQPSAQNSLDVDVELKSQSSSYNPDFTISPELFPEIFSFESTGASTESKRIYRWGGPPSDVYEPPNKIGNALLPAFTTKVDVSRLPQNLRPPHLEPIDDVTMTFTTPESPPDTPSSPGSPMNKD